MRAGDVMWAKVIAMIDTLPGSLGNCKSKTRAGSRDGLSVQELLSPAKGKATMCFLLRGIDDLCELYLAKLAKIEAVEDSTHATSTVQRVQQRQRRYT